MRIRFNAGETAWVVEDIKTKIISQIIIQRNICDLNNNIVFCEYRHEDKVKVIHQNELSKTFLLAENYLENIIALEECDDEE